MAEEGSFLGISGHDDIWFGGTTELATGQLAWCHSLNEDLTLTGRIELGSVAAGGGEGGGQASLISKMDMAIYSGFELGLQQSAVLTGNDQLTIWASQPMRIEESGTVLTLPSGRTRDGTILYQDHTANLTPQDRQIDIGLSYGIDWPEQDASLQIGIMHSFNEGHVAGQNATAIAARHAIRF